MSLPNSREPKVNADDVAEVAQLVRASVCGTEGRGFNSHLSPQEIIMFEIKALNDKTIADKIGDFLTSTDAFTHTWFPDEKESVKKAVLNSLGGGSKTSVLVHSRW